MSFAILTVLILCTACAEPTVPPTPTPRPPTPSPTPEPKVLTVCLPDEPDSLYIYGSDSLAAQHVWQAIYDGPLDNRNYAYQPVILADLPSLANGTAAVLTITVQAGDRVLAASDAIVELTPGTMVQDAGGERVTFDGTPVLMQQMVVTFTLRPDLYWSDGTLLTANDSVFSFALASDLSTPTDKTTIEHTASYQTIDLRTVVWTSVPGFLDHAYFLNFWHPLPLHAWGHIPAAELLNADVSTRQPLGWGPFVLHEWVAGDHITVARNPIYFRTPEGLPRVDEVIFRFIPDPTLLAEELLTGRCDVATHDAADAVRAALPDQSYIQALSTHDARWELLAFGISPSQSYNRPDFFEDVRVRQAIAMCIDRQAVVNQVLGPSGRVSHSYLPPEHPLYAGDSLITWEYASAAGQTLLAAAGWYDENGDGVREAHNIPGVTDDTPFQITYHTTDDPLRVQTAQLVQTYLASCGISVSVETLPPETLFAPGPEGVLFGQQFDLAQFSWRAVPTPLCDLFLSNQIPIAGQWYKPNITGFLDDEYDTACLSALDAPPDGAEYVAGHVQAQRIFSERLPALPLFQRLKVTLAHTSVTGLIPDPTHPSELWNIEQFDLQP
ncbi:MAG: ABC transporter substrate-binding protein [Anaerolineae bacterium]